MGKERPRFLYRIWNEETREIYIGLAMKWRRRYREHKSRPSANMRVFINGPHQVECLTECQVSAAAAAAMEQSFIERYRSEGWNVLNVRPGGSLGCNTDSRKPNGYWTLENLRTEAAKYKTRLEMYAANPSAYSLAGKRKLLNPIFANHPNLGRLTKKKPRIWTADRLAAEAKRFKTRMEMFKANPGAWTMAQRTGVLDAIFAEHEAFGFERPLGPSSRLLQRAQLASNSHAENCNGL